MIATDDFEMPLNENPWIEAIVRMSRDGLPLQSRSRSNMPVDEIVSIAAGLFSTAATSHLMRDDTSACMFINAEHGALYIKAEKGNTLLLVLTDRDCTEQQVEAMIAAYDHPAMPADG
jgi:predicted regulator of Ras-like GTPase activity (Roadblock/LC7/MglB family)